MHQPLWVIWYSSPLVVETAVWPRRLALALGGFDNMSPFPFFGIQVALPNPERMFCQEALPFPEMHQGLPIIMSCRFTTDSLCNTSKGVVIHRRERLDFDEYPDFSVHPVHKASGKQRNHPFAVFNHRYQAIGEPHLDDGTSFRPRRGPIS
jgi:hypothetical protein